MCLEQYLGNVNLKKKQNLLVVFRTSIDSCFAGPTLFLLVSGTGPPGYFEDCMCRRVYNFVNSKLKSNCLNKLRLTYQLYIISTSSDSETVSEYSVTPSKARLLTEFFILTFNPICEFDVWRHPLLWRHLRFVDYECLSKHDKSRDAKNNCAPISAWLKTVFSDSPRWLGTD